MVEKLLSFRGLTSEYQLTDSKREETLKLIALTNIRRMRVMAIIIFLLELALVLFYDFPQLSGKGVLGTSRAHQYLYCHSSLLLVAGLSYFHIKTMGDEDVIKRSRGVLLILFTITISTVAYVSGLDQFVSGQIVAYIVVMVVAAMFLLIEIKYLPIYLIPHGIFVFAMLTMQSDVYVRRINIINGTILMVTSMIVAGFMYNQYFLQMLQSIQLKETNEKLEYLANHDPLTGLYNRRRFEEQLIAMRDRRLNTNALVIMDLDNFKITNDLYGHAMADDVLFEVSRFFRSKMLNHELVARWGGEEFVFFISRDTREEVINTVESIRKGMCNIEFDSNGLIFNVTGSFGVCFVNQSSENVIKDGYPNADEALYLAKTIGKNRVEVFKG